MSKRYWLYGSAIGGAVGLLFVAALVWCFANAFWPDDPGSHDPHPIPSQIQYLEAHLDADCLALNAAPRVSDPNPKETEDCRDKEAAQKYNHASLVQSIRASNAALYSAYIVYLQTCIGIVGAILVVLTLLASAGGAWAAAVAARGTINAARSTKDSVDLARHQISLSHRPKIRVRKVRMHPTTKGKPIVIEAEIVNVGDGNADVFFIDYRVVREKIDGAAGSGALHLSGGELRRVYMMAPGTSCVTAIPTDLMWRDNFEGAPHGFTVSGQVSYRDTFIGKPDDHTGMSAFRAVERRTSFHRFYKVREADGGVRFAVTEKSDPECEYED